MTRFVSAASARNVAAAPAPPTAVWLRLSAKRPVRAAAYAAVTRLKRRSSGASAGSFQQQARRAEAGPPEAVVA
jgi:hypothetical protein